MKVTIDLEDLKRYINTLRIEKDEWYGPEYSITGHCILSFFKFNDNKKIAKEFDLFLKSIEDLNRD